MNDPEFSIVIPTYNRSDLVSHAIASALAQTFEDFEVVVSDNHSSDDTAAVVARFDDARVRYVKPPEHCPLPDNWEFVRTQARGRFVMLLGDDDALLSNTLARFAAAQKQFDADVLFCAVAEYLDPNFAGPKPNTLVCFPFTDGVEELHAADLLDPLFSRLEQPYRLDPSAFVFSRALADRVAAHCGRFFHTQGAEYFAWPLAVAAANRIVHLATPLVVVGRTAKSWGTNMLLVNPGDEQINRLLADVTSDAQRSPIKSFTLANMMVNGMLTAKAAWPELLADYDVNQRAFVQAVYRELDPRQLQGVDVGSDLRELKAYVAENPSYGPLQPSGESWTASIARRAKRKARRVSARFSPTRAVTGSGFKMRGAEHGFVDIIGATDVLERVVERPDAALAGGPSGSSA